MKCVVCGKEFKPKRSTQLCCSEECSKEHFRLWRYNRYHYGKTMKAERKCPICGKMFEVSRPNQRSCSNKCCNQYRHDYVIDFTYPVNCTGLVFDENFFRYFFKKN